MWGRVYSPVVLLIFINIIFEASCKGKGSLTFLIDDTGSMSDDIDQVRSSANRIMDIVFQEKSSLIDNMVLVTFNDPDAQVRAVTKDRYTFKRTLDAVYAHNIHNRDCWEPSMKGLRLALERSHRDSYIYVFTDAPAKDYRDGHYVKEMCQKKQSQIVFVLTGRCRDYYGPQPFDVYFDIADACSGLAFDVTKGEVEQVLRTIAETIKGNKTVLTSTTVPANVYKDIPFTIDDQTDYAIVSVSGKNVYLYIRGPTAYQEQIMYNSNAKVVKLSNVKAGTYVATVMGQTRTSVIIVGRTDFLFSHGFSELKPKSPGDTTPQPIADANVHLSISITDEHHSVKIISAEILRMDEVSIKVLPLTEISKDFYVTTPFVAPSQRFKVAVNGIAKATGKPIRRIAKIPVTPQERPKVLPNKTKPTAYIAEGQTTEVEYNSTVKLTCKVTAFPEPKIKWINSKGTTMSSASSVIEYPYEYISYMEISHTSEGDKYTCYAVNDVGKDSKTIKVIVKEPFTVHTVPTGSTTFVYGSEGIITCDIRSRLPMDIRWYHANMKSGILSEIKKTDEKYWISPNHSQLKIKKMDVGLDGKYTCTAHLKNKRNVQKIFKTIVILGGLIVPKVQGPTEIKVTRGKTAVFECKIVNGIPAPNITWWFGGTSGLMFLPVAGTTNVLRITNVDDKHTGKYKCLAKNIAGEDEHVIKLFIQDLPKIASSRSIVHQATEGDPVLSIPCIAAGVPKPVISWKLNGLAISPNSKYSIKDGALIIKDPKVSDTNSYTCEAKNEAGSVSATFKTYIRQAPQVSGVAVKKVTTGSTASIECKVIKGEPKPKITWQYADNSRSHFLPIPGTDTVLHISMVEKKHAGRYKCVAQNTVGSNEHVTTLEVQELPKITSNVSTVYQSTEGEALFRIPCTASGLPKPSITWKLNGRDIIPNAKYSMQDGVLIIRDPKVTDPNWYTCEAKNEVGSVSATFRTHIRQAPKVSGVASKKVRVGTPATIECTVIKGEPKPNITWQYTDNSGSKFVPIPGTDKVLRISRVERKHAGRYKCVARNIVGSNEHVTTLEVQELPKITSNVSTVYQSTEGEALFRIPCTASGLPKPSITWKLNGRDIIPNAKYSMQDGVLIIRDPKVTDPNWYTCEAKNEVGSVSATFRTHIRQAPKVSGVASKKVRVGTPATIECTVIKGEPKPNITWQYTDNSGSKFVPIPGTDKVLRISRVERKHAGRYKCVARNIVGSNEHVTTLEVQELPKITSNVSTVYQSTEGDALLRIPCTASGLPKPSITWKLNGRNIIPNTKYSMLDGVLTIRNPTVTDPNWYTCEAKNEVGSVSATFKTYISQVPQVSGVASKEVKIGTPTTIECKVVKGEPKPKITWQFMDKSASKFVPIVGSENVLRITRAEKKHAGRYKCVAQNTVGSNEHVTTLIVESPPEIASNSTTVDGIEGDMALRIPCDVVGIPKPVITWKLKGVTIKSSAKYSIEDGALVIMDPKKKDSSSYTCEAKNYLGTVSSTVKAKVLDYLDTFGKEHHVYIIKGTTKKLECEAYKNNSQAVRWFQNLVENKMKNTYIQIEKASYADDGNYTCRVSDKHGYIQTHTYLVDVGYPPKLNDPNYLADWRGDIDEIATNCDSFAKPTADVEWRFNGKVITEPNLADIGITYKWGHYTCNVSNVHGSVQRSFNVKSSACLLSRNLRDAQYMPLILTDQESWPTWETTKYYSIVEQEEKITLSCTSRKDMPNTFKKFPKQSKLTALCYKEDTFIVDGKFYKISELQCSNAIQLAVNKKKVKCATGTSELIRVGYNVDGFLETYEVCFDHAKNMPLYTRVLMDNTDGSLTAAHHWYTYPGIGDNMNKRGFNCTNTLSSCCYGKSQLVSARDFNNVPAKNSTFIDPLNAVPAWYPCDTSKTTWENINDMVREQLINFSEFVAWSGTHTLQEKHGAVIPRYLWKVVRFDVDEAIAIVHVNDPTPTVDDIKCKNICNKIDEPWFKVSDQYTYCCSLPEFFKKFDIHGTDIGESLDAARDKIEKST